MEFDRTANPLRIELVEEEFEMEGTKMKIPRRPGLGITLDREALKKYQIS
jgi:D-galactarolactone cycloisomerase